MQEFTNQFVAAVLPICIAIWIFAALFWLYTYNSLPDAKAMAKHFKTILALLTPLSRPDQSTRDAHIASIKHNTNKRHPKL